MWSSIPSHGDHPAKWTGGSGPGRDVYPARSRARPGSLGRTYPPARRSRRDRRREAWREVARLHLERSPSARTERITPRSEIPREITPRERRGCRERGGGAACEGRGPVIPAWALGGACGAYGACGIHGTGSAPKRAGESRPARSGSPPASRSRPRSVPPGLLVSLVRLLTSRVLRTGRTTTRPNQTINPLETGSGLGRASRAETAPERVSENRHYRKLEQNQTLTSRRFG